MSGLKSSFTSYSWKKYIWKQIPFYYWFFIVWQLYIKYLIYIINHDKIFSIYKTKIKLIILYYQT